MGESNPISWLVPLVQLGSFGVLVALIAHIVKVQIPAQDKRSDARETAFLGAIDKIHQDCAKERDVMFAAFENQMTLQRAHDAQEIHHLAEALNRRGTRSGREKV